jgi:argininosuccinate lyase
MEWSLNKVTTNRQAHLNCRRLRMSDYDDRDDYQQEAEDLLETIEQVEETLTVMSKVVGQLKEQVASHLDPYTVEMSAEEFLEQCENLEGTWH